MAAVDWKPEVDENGNTSYVAEQGDNAATLADQYGSQQQADQLTGGRDVRVEKLKYQEKKLRELKVVMF